MDRKVRDKILKVIKPSSKEHDNRVGFVQDFISKLKAASDLDVEYFVGGSFGKNTYLTSSSDVDIFARFNSKYSDDELSSYVVEILEKAGIKYKKQKGSRDYYSTEVKGIKFEIVPNRRISSIDDMINSTDASPLHVEFLQGKAKENENLCDEIRLAKQFFKSKGLYGAESYINGLSGHVIDILIAFYGSLNELLVGIKEWSDETYIDINGFYSSIEDAKGSLDEDKLSKLILVDPILKSRNAARALSDENYSRLLILAHNFEKFSEKDFIVKKFHLMKTIRESKKFGKVNGLNTLFYVFDFNIGDDSEDIIGSKLLKLSRKIERRFVENDFRVFLSKFYISMSQGKCLFVYFVENLEVPRLKKVVGPYVHMKDAINAFTAARKYYFIEGDRLYSYETRKVYTLDKLAKINLDGCTDLLGKDMSFLKKIRVFRK